MRTSLHHVLLVCIVSATASLACLTGAPASAPTPAVSFATVTPGGRISVSLLEPAPSGGIDMTTQGTPIGPVGTATADAATAIAQTAVALTAGPTYPGLFTRPALCPLPGTPILPEEAPPFNRYAETVAQYLSAGGATTVLEARLRSWGAIVDYGGLVLTDRDFTGDGVPEVLMVALDPQRAAFPYPGELFIFGCDEGAYRLLYQSGSANARSAPLLYRADDINGDYLNELVYATQDCSGTLCVTEVEIIAWNLTLGVFGRLLGEEVRAPLADVQVTDLEGDGRWEVIVTSGTVEAPDAGPQRVFTTTLRWDGTQYTIASVEASPSPYRIHVIHDADNAFRAGDYAGAIDLYRRAVRDEALLSWLYPDEAQHLTAYARYRIMLARVAQGDVAAAQRVRDDLVEEYAASPGAPGYHFAEMARLFWHDFAINRDIGSACRLVIGYARALPASYEVLNSFGSANLTYTPEDLCPLGG